jgi:AMP-binding enzyme
MILGDPASARPAPITGRLTIDAVFRQLAARQPDALALADPPNREAFTDGVPRRLTYAEADRMVAAIAARLLRMGLPPDSIVGVQLPNIVENVLTMLGVLRAGMIVAPMPLLWRRVDAAAALARISAKALITCGRVGAFDHCHLAREIASEVFSIRYICGFGKSLPDGVVALDDLFDARDAEPALERDARSPAAAHVAAITFEVGADGVIPVARNHAELLAGGLGVLLESRLPERTNILSAILPSSFAGFSATLVPWLLSAGALVLHQPFTADVLTRQRREYRCATLILPGPVAVDLAEIDARAGERPSRVIASWQSPAQLADGRAWRDQNAIFVDVSSFGEIALVPARRDSDGRPSQLALGPVITPHEHKDGIVVVELARTAAGTIAARGPMVPRHPFPPGIERTGVPGLKIGPGELLDTGYPCRLDAATGAIAVTGGPAGVVSVGGYRFPQRALQDAIGRVHGSGTLAGGPCPLLGRRMIGNAADRATLAAALAAAGFNPLLAAAFGDHGWRTAPAAA